MAALIFRVIFGIIARLPSDGEPCLVFAMGMMVFKQQERSFADVI